MDDAIIVNEDGSVTAVAQDVDIYEYAKEFGGTVILRRDYVPPPYVPTLEDLEANETDWRGEQMSAALEMVTAFKMDEEGLPGTEQLWKSYWVALRKWTDTNPDFPDSDKRPVAPT